MVGLHQFFALYEVWKLFFKKSLDNINKKRNTQKNMDFLYYFELRSKEGIQCLSIHFFKH